MEPAPTVLGLDGHGPRYTQIIRALVALIRRGALSPGSRAPAPRELARDLECSRNVLRRRPDCTIDFNPRPLRTG